VVVTIEVLAGKRPPNSIPSKDAVVWEVAAVETEGACLGVTMVNVLAGTDTVFSVEAGPG
jgi:hypothetical protein